ncbi:MAG: 23S rRNA (pseudouridine(1915)-N(3))-methyltransferase RlmH [Bacteroidales bacterium]|nr:23S rRNA (pseudouridine(1915)-N(3))-methyltransferase RlmH [Bacteroidales bacterium]
MKLVFLMVGKTNEKYFTDAISEYEKRIKRFIPFEIITIPDSKGIKTAEQQKTTEGELILKHTKDEDFVILMDEKGKRFTSVKFAEYVERLLCRSDKRVIFVIGGAYGFSDAVYNRADDKISLSDMTFSHQLVRVVFTEQLYRAFTIINNQPYHHE